MIVRIFNYTSMVPSLIYSIAAEFRIYSVLDIISPRVTPGTINKYS